MNRKRSYRSILGPALMLTALGLLQSCIMNEEWDPYYNETPGRVEENVLKIIGEEPDFSLFHDAAMEYGFGDLLSKNQYFTVFVPVNAAFEGLPDYTTEEWKKIIGFHILYAKLFSHDFAGSDLMTTIGKYLHMKVEGEEGNSISGSEIDPNRMDRYCQNGVIHAIDRLLIPKPNLYEYIMSLDTTYSILQEFLNSMDERYIDYEKSERIGVDDNGNAIYDTVWQEENYFLDQIAGLNDEEGAFTGFLPNNDHVSSALETVSEYFGNIAELDPEAYNQLLFIIFSGSFTNGSFQLEDLPDTVQSVTGKTIEKSTLTIRQKNVEVSNGTVHLLDGMLIPKSYFLVPVTIECDKREGRTVSNTVYPIEELGDTRASNGSYVSYGCQFVGDYLEFEVDMVLKTTYWVVWTGPKQGPSHYQISIRDESTGQFVNVGPPVNNWTKGWFNLVVSGTYAFTEFGTKHVRITIVDEQPLPGFNSIFVDYIKLIPDEIYDQ